MEQRKLFETIYREVNQETTNRDKLELMTDFIGRLREIIYKGQFIIEALTEE